NFEFDLGSRLHIRHDKGAFGVSQALGFGTAIEPNPRSGDGRTHDLAVLCDRAFDETADRSPHADVGARFNLATADFKLARARAERRPNSHSRTAHGQHLGLRRHAIVSHNLRAIFTRIGREAHSADLKLFSSEHRLRGPADLHATLRLCARTDLEFTRVRRAVSVALYEQ